MVPADAGKMKKSTKGIPQTVSTKRNTVWPAFVGISITSCKDGEVWTLCAQTAEGSSTQHRDPFAGLSPSTIREHLRDRWPGA